MTRIATAIVALAAANLLAASAEQIEVMKKMFARLDKDKDGCVTREEYVGLFSGAFTPQDKNKDNVLTPDEFKHGPAFKYGDADKDGKLTRDEYRRIYTSQHKGLDKNKDGTVTTDEYVPAPMLPDATAQQLAAQRQQVLALGELTAAPKMMDAQGFPAADSIKAIYYDALPWKGKPTKAFGWLGIPAKRDGKIPGVVLVHGGGGTAFKDWVRRWNDRGFAAISIAVEGQSDRRAGEGDEKTETGWLRHEWAGPQRRGIYNDSGEPLKDQWMYHAVSQTILANSLLRSLPEVDSDKVGLMGISWGGVITSTVLGIDTRFAFAIPTYGCGDLGTAENVYGRVLGKNNVYRQVWDPMLYLQRAKMPVLWFSWPEDSHFPMDCLAASYHATSGPRQVTLIPKMGHGHGPPWNAQDSYAFADSVVNTGKPWCRQTGVDLQDGKAQASFASTKPLDRTLLVSTTDTGFTGKRKWMETPATLERKGDEWTASAKLPKGTTAWFLNAYSGKLVVSSDYQETKKVRAAAKGTVPDAMWTYKEVDGKELKLSVFLPDDYDAGSRFPAFVAFHGGSWNAGNANWHYPDCAYWSKRGMVAVSVDYRLKDRDKVQVPLDCVKDAKSAIRFLRKNAEKLKIYPDKIVVAGGSAGGQLAAATAMLTSTGTNDDQYDPAISCKPNAVVLWNPWFKCQKDLSPPNFVTEGLPPVITFLGDQDPGIPPESLLAFHESLKKAENASEYYVGKGGKHGFCNGRNPANPFFHWSLELTDQFLVKHGMLTGPSKVEVPRGVKALGDGDFRAYR